MSTTTRKAKFTFRREPRRTGLAGVGYSRQSVRIKHRGMNVGMIHAPNWTTKDGACGTSRKMADSFRQSR